MPVGVQCPISSSLGEFPAYWDWLWYPGLLSVLVSIAFSLRLPYLSVFSIHCFFTWNWISFVFLLYDQHICTRSVNPFLGEFSGLELRYLILWSQRRSRCVHGSEISIQISAPVEV